MHLITKALSSTYKGQSIVPITVDRHKLSRRRWRCTAPDGTDFGFDVAEALSHGDLVFETDTTSYLIEQAPEDCLLISVSGAREAAWIGWMVGNLHFNASFSEEGMLVQDDLAVVQMLDQEHIKYDRVVRVFQPTKRGGHSHDHVHSHSH